MDRENLSVYSFDWESHRQKFDQIYGWSLLRNWVQACTSLRIVGSDRF